MGSPFMASVDLIFLLEGEEENRCDSVGSGVCVGERGIRNMIKLPAKADTVAKLIGKLGARAKL